MQRERTKMLTENVFEIARKKIGKGHPCFIIAEAGVNHNGRLELALELVDLAAAAGADAIKFQTFQAEKVISSSAPKAKYQVDSVNPSETQLEMVKKLELDESAHIIIAEHCRKKNVMFLSTPFDYESVELLGRLAVPAFKVGSGELTNLPFLEYLATQKKPIILSTGMASLAEVEAGIHCISKFEIPFALLHCVSNYPARPEDVNLRAMQTLAEAFKVPVGFSDHTLGIEISLAAVAMGASIIEKHFTLDKTLVGPDHKASLSPQELKDLVKGIRSIESAFGDGIKRPAQSELEIASVARRSIVASCDIPANVEISHSMLTYRRPGTGLPPSFFKYLVGRKTKHDIKAEQLIALEMLQ